MRASTGSPAFARPRQYWLRACRREVALQMGADHGVPLLFARREHHAVAEEPALLTSTSRPPNVSMAALDELTSAVPVGDVVGVGDGLAARRGDLVDDLLGRPDRRPSRRSRRRGR